MRVVTSGNWDSCAAVEHAGRAGAHDEDVNFVGKLGWAVDADSGGRLDSRVTGYVTVVVELHGLSSLLCGLSIAAMFDNRTAMFYYRSHNRNAAHSSVQVFAVTYHRICQSFLRKRRMACQDQVCRD